MSENKFIGKSTDAETIIVAIIITKFVGDPKHKKGKLAEMQILPISR